MQAGRPIELNGKPIAGGKVPLVCTPLVGRSADAILCELERIVPKRPDVLEWRVDFFDRIGDAEAVIATAGRIRQAAGGTPLLFTRRSAAEGGEAIALGEQQVVALYEALCAARAAELVDFEMRSDPAHLRRVREAARANGIALVLSYHDFTQTPPAAEILQRFRDAQALGADVAKVALMPRGPDDVLTLLAATLQASRELPIPLISMSMGGYGALTRMFGWAFGSALTFAIGDRGSAPGQMPIEDLQAVLAIAAKAFGGK
jgi:3-dehydroquinate dehydratase-1